MNKKITVSKMIELLKKFDKNSEVTIRNIDIGGSLSISDIKEVEVFDLTKEKERYIYTDYIEVNTDLSKKIVTKNLKTKKIIVIDC